MQFKIKNASLNSCSFSYHAVFHNGSNYDHHFIIEKLANEFEEQFKCLGENKEKYKYFSVPIKNEIEKMIKMAIKVLKLYHTK